MDRSHKLGELIEGIVFETVRHASTRTKYREPLVVSVDADDSLFQALKTVVDPAHLLPSDILPGARTVVSFFIPFAAETVRANRRRRSFSEEWAIAYEETNQLIEGICRTIGERLSALGFHAAWEQPTHNFDREKLVARWSHKSVARIAGLGSFGRHQMLVTPAGCAGRFGSIVTDANLSVVPKISAASVLLCDKGCKVCLRLCPVGALSESSLDKQRCYARCLEADSYFKSKLGGVHDVCGKCATGPCALTDQIERPTGIGQSPKSPFLVL